MTQISSIVEPDTNPDRGGGCNNKIVYTCLTSLGRGHPVIEARGL